MKKKITIAVIVYLAVFAAVYIWLCIPRHYSDSVTVMNAEGETLELVVDLTLERDLFLRRVWKGSIEVEGALLYVTPSPQSSRKWSGLPLIPFISIEYENFDDGPDFWEGYDLCLKKIDGKIVYGFFVYLSQKYEYTLGNYISGVNSPEAFEEMRWKMYPRTGSAVFEG